MSTGRKGFAFYSVTANVTLHKLTFDTFGGRFPKKVKFVA